VDADANCLPYFDIINTFSVHVLQRSTENVAVFYHIKLLENLNVQNVKWFLLLGTLLPCRTMVCPCFFALSAQCPGPVLYRVYL